MTEAQSISIHALLAESDNNGHEQAPYIAGISIHALLAESDWVLMGGLNFDGNFYPRSPCGERLCLYRLSLIALPISIHALLAESDRALRQLQSALRHFYPRSPCGERHITQRSASSLPSFLSTLSLRRATNGHEQAPYIAGISIHALLAESDPPRVIREPATGGFLSTLSLRRATTIAFNPPVKPAISIHALLAESDTRRTYQQGEKQAFLSTLSLRRATSSIDDFEPSTTHFYPRSPCGERPL